VVREVRHAVERDRWVDGLDDHPAAPSFLDAVARAERHLHRTNRRLVAADAGLGNRALAGDCAAGDGSRCLDGRAVPRAGLAAGLTTHRASVLMMRLAGMTPLLASPLRGEGQAGGGVGRGTDAPPACLWALGLNQ